MRVKELALFHQSSRWLAQPVMPLTDMLGFHAWALLGFSFGEPDGAAVRRLRQPVPGRRPGQKV